MSESYSKIDEFSPAYYSDEFTLEQAAWWWRGLARKKIQLMPPVVREQLDILVDAAKRGEGKILIIKQVGKITKQKKHVVDTPGDGWGWKHVAEEWEEDYWPKSKVTRDELIAWVKMVGCPLPPFLGGDRASTGKQSNINESRLKGVGNDKFPHFVGGLLGLTYEWDDLHRHMYTINSRSKFSKIISNDLKKKGWSVTAQTIARYLDALEKDGKWEKG